MTVLQQYEPEVYQWIGVREYDFEFESIGPIAFEIWLETETEVDGIFDRVMITPNWYTLTFGKGNPISTGGHVSISPAYEIPDTVDFISIERNTPIKQLCDFKNYTAFRMPMIEFALDKLTMIIQEISYRKCGVVVALPIEQRLVFAEYKPLYSTSIDFALDKLTAYCLQMVTSGEDCSNDLPAANPPVYNTKPPPGGTCNELVVSPHRCGD